MKNTRTPATLVVLLILMGLASVLASGCVGEPIDEAQVAALEHESDDDHERDEHDDHGRLHRGPPQRLLTRIVVADADDDDDREFGEGITVPAGVTVGFISTHDRGLFPFRGTPRTFATAADAVAFARATLGARVIFGGKAHAPVGFESRSATVGSSYFADDRTQTLYRVTDPVASLLGDIDGRIVIGGVTGCLDFDGTCVPGQPASYLVPLSDPSGIDQCSSDGLLCTYDSSFFNKTWVFLLAMQYARDGGNNFRHSAALPNAPPPPPTPRFRICNSSAPDAHCFTGLARIPVCVCAVPPPPPPVPGALSLNVSVQLQSSGDFGGAGTPIIELGTLTAHDTDVVELASEGTMFGVGPDVVVCDPTTGFCESASPLPYRADGICSAHTTCRMSTAQNVTNVTQNATVANPSLCPLSAPCD